PVDLALRLAVLVVPVALDGSDVPPHPEEIDDSDRKAADEDDVVDLSGREHAGLRRARRDGAPFGKEIDLDHEITLRPAAPRGRPRSRAWGRDPRANPRIPRCRRSG